MHQAPCAGEEGGDTTVSCCPTCARPFAAGPVCWGCCDRLCRLCGQQTGSAFIDICWPCWFRGSGEPGPATAACRE
jgi:hypothetical protein